MGRKAKIVNLEFHQRAELEDGYKNSPSPQYSRRCHIILLKSQGYSSKQIAEIFGITIQPVNNWVNRYLLAGIVGLRTKVGQGRPPILDPEKDQEKIKKAVKKERQRLKLAKDDLEKNLGKKFSLKTLQRFLKNLSADTNGYD